MSGPRSFLAFLACALLGACASPPARVDLSPGAAAGVRTVAVVLPPEPRAYSVLNMGNPALAFALVGGIFVAADQDEKQAKLYKAMTIQNFSLARLLGAQLVRKLAEDGYRTRLAQDAWEERNGRPVLRPERAAQGADALLVVVPITTGFVARGPTADYVPTVTVLARLLSPDGRTELYRAYHAFGWQPRADDWRFTPASAGFSDFDALMAHPAASAAALARGTEAIAARVARDVRRP